MGQVATITLDSVNYSVYGVTSDPITDATSYLNARLGGGAWAAASADDQKRALISAVRWMDRAVTWDGSKTVSTQDLQWPRDDVTNSCTGEAVADGTVPDEIAETSFELALVILNDNAAQDAASQGSNVKSAQAGSAKVEFFSSTLGSTQDTKLPQAANDIASCFYGSSGTQVGEASGTSESSSFCDTDWELNEGWK